MFVWPRRCVRRIPPRVVEMRKRAFDPFAALAHQAAAASSPHPATIAFRTRILFCTLLRLGDQLLGDAELAKEHIVRSRSGPSMTASGTSDSGYLNVSVEPAVREVRTVWHARDSEPFEVADQQQAEVAPGCQARSAHHGRVEPVTQASACRVTAAA